jgi:ABC-type multidrug transport system ATPase subunit
MSSIRLRGEAIEKRYGRVAALRGVDFEISPGESVAILGANGAGKSSLLKILAGLSRPSAGCFEGLAGEPVSERNPTSPQDRTLSREALRSQVGYVGHATLIYSELSARENLLFAARLHGQRPTPERLDRVLDEFSLLDVADRRAATFSRGMAQRLSIARAVVHEPGLLLLDEPFTGLDELSAQQLSAQLAGQRENGRTLVLVTHDPRRAVELSDRALVLHRGRIRARPARAENGAEAAFEVDALRHSLAALAIEANGASV